MSKSVVIYGLVDPRTNQIRYVGKSNNLKRRMAGHKHEALHHKGTHKNNWLKGIYTSGLSPITFVLETVVEEAWEDAERFWIAYFKYIGADLLNTATGGDTFPRYDCTGIPKTEEHKRKISEANRGKTVPESLRAKRQGSLNPGSVLSEAEVKALMEELVQRGITKKALSEKYGISLANIRKIQKGSAWGHLNVDRPDLPKLYCRSLNLEEVKEIRRLYREGTISMRALERMYRCATSTILKALTHSEWNSLLNDHDPIHIRNRVTSLRLVTEQTKDEKQCDNSLAA